MNIYTPFNSLNTEPLIVTGNFFGPYIYTCEKGGHSEEHPIPDFRADKILSTYLHSVPSDNDFRKTTGRSSMIHFKTLIIDLTSSPPIHRTWTTENNMILDRSTPKHYMEIHNQQARQCSQNAYALALPAPYLTNEIPAHKQAHCCGKLNIQHRYTQAAFSEFRTY